MTLRPKRIRVVVAGVLVTLAMASVVPVIGAAAPTEDQIADAVRLRSGLGFRADVDFIRAAIGDAVGFPDREWGVPLSRTEAAEVARRVAIQLAKSDAAVYAKALTESAGVYTDQLDGGAPVFLFAGDASSQLGEIESRLPAGTRFRVDTVSRSTADLEAIRLDVDLAKPSLLKQGIDVILTGIDTSANRLMLGVNGLTPSAEEVLRERFGDGIAVRDQRPGAADACTFSSCWPPKGGFKVTGSKGFGCTSGFVASKENNPNSLALLTAGHCSWVNGGAGTNFTHNGLIIGPSTGHTFVSGADADAVFITINAANNPPAKNLYIDTPPDTHALTVVVETANQDQGDVICRTGITSNKDCGQIVLENVTNQSCVTVSGVTTCKNIDHTWEVNFDSAGGDSGGPYHLGTTTGFGIHIHSDGPPDYAPGNRGWYSPLGWVRTEYFNRFGVFYSYCTSASCNTHWP